jgi:DNA-binding XRE family transcriptional regulator
MVTPIQGIPDFARQEAEIANRLGEARDFLGVTQAEFARQISVTRDRLASIEDGRTVLRADVALRICRQFFINEFWLALGSVNEAKFKAGERAAFAEVDARLTMSLAIEHIAFGIVPGDSYAMSFSPHLRQEYSRLLTAHSGLPRIIPLVSDGPDYYKNALNCLMAFWNRGLNPAQWRSFFSTLFITGATIHAEAAKMNPETTELAVKVSVSPKRQG